MGVIVFIFKLKFKGKTTTAFLKRIPVLQELYKMRILCIIQDDLAVMISCCWLSLNIQISFKVVFFPFQVI